LAVDIQHHLNNEPISARPPSSIYRFRKMIRRNKLAFGAAAMVVAALLLGIAASTWQAVRATQAKQEALSAQQQAQASETKALDAQANEANLRRQAQADELIARQRGYASDMNVAMEALRSNNLGRAQDLLDRQRPQPGEVDLRGWEWRYLWGQTRSDALSVLCKKTEIESLAVSSDGRWLAIGVVHRDGLFVWDLQTRQEVAHLAKGRVEVRAVFSPTGPLLAFAAEDNAAGGKPSLSLWNAATRQFMAELPLEGWCDGLAFSQDGRTLVTSTGSNQKGQITLWRVSDAEGKASAGAQLASYPSEQASMAASTAFAATGDLSIAAYGMDQGRVRVVDLRNGKELWTAVASNIYITALAFSPDGKTLATAAGFGESDIRLWEVATGKEIGRLQGHTAWVGSLVFWPDGKRLASASADQTIRTWDVPSRTCTDVLRGHRLEVWRLALLPDNRTLVSGCKDGTVCLWDTSVTHPRREYITWPENLINWSFAPDSRSVLTVNPEGQVAQWIGSDFQEKEPLLETGIKGTANEDDVFSADGRFLASPSPDGNISVWDILRRSLSLAFKPATGRLFPQTFLAQGSRLVVWSEADNCLIEWDLAANRQIQSWAAPAEFANGGVSPDEQQLVAAGQEGDFSIRNLAQQSSTNTHLDILETFGMWAFAPSGKLVAAGSSLGYARVWDTGSWKEVATLARMLHRC
jgi:WD40 repeat protein